jgi:hypothetical protein
MFYTVFGFRSGAAFISSSVPGSAAISRLPGPKQGMQASATLLLRNGTGCASGFSKKAHFVGPKYALSFKQWHISG